MTKAMARLIQEENITLDGISGGELYTILSAGFDSARIYCHGNKKSMEELKSYKPVQAPSSWIMKTT